MQRRSRFGQAVVDQEGEIVPAGPQRRQLNMVGPQAIIEVLAKRARVHVLHHVTVGGHDQAGPALPRAVGPEGIVGVLLQEAQQFDLRDRRQVAYLVQKQGALLGPGDQAITRPVCARKGPARMAKQGVGEHLIVEAGHINRHKVAAGRGEPMHGPRHELLARARFAGNEHRLRRPGNGCDIAKERVHGRVVGHDLRKGLALGRGVTAQGLLGDHLLAAGRAAPGRAARTTPAGACPPVSPGNR